MFELVDSQPSHLINTEAINLTPGKPICLWTFLKLCVLILSVAESSFADFSDSDRLERFFDSEDEEFEILSL